MSKTAFCADKSCVMFARDDSKWCGVHAQWSRCPDCRGDSYCDERLSCHRCGSTGLVARSSLKIDERGE